MSTLFDEAVLITLAEEGVKIDLLGHVIDSGYSNNPKDSGGETKFGISAKYLGRSPKDITLEQAKELYNKDFWLGTHCDSVMLRSEPLAVMLFDIAVNQGPGTAIRMLQRVVGVNPDGFIGPVTLRKITIDREELFLQGLTLARIERYIHIALVSKSQLGFLCGWIIRAQNILRYCQRMILSGSKS